MPEPVLVLVAVGVPVAVAVAVSHAVPEFDPVFELLAPAVSDDVGVSLVERERLGVVDGVVAGVPDPVGVTLLVGVPVASAVTVVLGVAAFEPEDEALAPIVRDDVDEGDSVELALVVVDGVPLDVPVGDAVADGVSVPLPLLVGELDALAPGLSEPDVVVDKDALSVSVLVGVPVGVPLPVGVCVPLCD